MTLSRLHPSACAVTLLESPQTDLDMVLSVDQPTPDPATFYESLELAPFVLIDGGASVANWHTEASHIAMFHGLHGLQSHPSQDDPSASMECSFYAFINADVGGIATPSDAVYEWDVDDPDTNNRPEATITCKSPPREAAIARTGLAKIQKHLRPSQCLSDNDDDGEMEKSTCSGNQAVPGAKNLVYERLRRQKLNDKLFHLRALVPNISKLDKASIVRDAIEYVRNLKMQADHSQEEISLLHSKIQLSRAEASLLRLQQRRAAYDILNLDIVKMDQEAMYHLKVECRKGDGAFVQIARALEALNLSILNANLSTVGGRLLNTVVFQVKPIALPRTEELRGRILQIFSKFGLREAGPNSQ